jgi:hypothetical protein
MKSTTRRSRRFLLLTLVLLFGAGAAVAAGVLSTEGATIAAGTAPIKGPVVIDAAAPRATRPVLPALWELPDMGEMGAPEDAPDFGDGADGEVTVTEDQVLDGGIWNFESLTIENGAVLTCNAGVTILVRGDCGIEGEIHTHGAGQPITLRCGGDFRLVGRVETAEMRSPIEISVGGDIRIGDEGADDDPPETWVSTSHSPVSVTAYGNITAHHWTIYGYNSCQGMEECSEDFGLTVRTAGSMTLNDTRVDGHWWPVRMQVHGEMLRLLDGTNIRGGEKLIESKGGIEIDDSAVRTVSAAYSIKAFGGDVRMTASRIGSTAGDVLIQARQAVEVLEATEVGTTIGRIDIFADVIRVISGPEHPPLGPGEEPGVDSTSGHITLHAESELTIEGSEVGVGTTGSAVDLQCHGGPLTIASDAEVHSTTGAIDIRAWGPIETGSGVRIRGTSLRISSGPPGMHLAGEVSGGWDALYLLSSGTIRIESTYVRGLGIFIASTHGDVDLTGADLHTGTIVDGTGLTASGDILIEAWQPGSLIADGANIRSGEDQIRSGSVQLLLHEADEVEEPKDLALTGFLLPRTIKVKLSETKPKKGRLTAKGCLDIGPGAISSQATVEIGDVTLIANVRRFSGGRAYRMNGDGLSIRLRRASANSSCFKLKLKLKGELSDRIDPDGELMLRLRTGNVEGAGEVALEDGFYRLGTETGALVRPEVFPVRARARLADGGQGRLRLRAGFATAGEVPVRAPEVEIRFADLDLTVPADRFEASGPGVFVADAPDDGSWIGQLRLDFNRGQLVLNAKGIDLGEIAEGDVTLTVAFDGEARAVRVVAVQTGAQVRY